MKTSEGSRQLGNSEGRSKQPSGPAQQPLREHGEGRWKGLRTSPASLGRSCSSWTEKRGSSSPANLTRAPRKQKKPTFFLVTPQHPPFPSGSLPCSKHPQLPGDSAWTTADHRRADTRARLQAELCPSVLQSLSLHNEDVVCTSHGGCREDEGRGLGSHLHSFCPLQRPRFLDEHTLFIHVRRCNDPIDKNRVIRHLRINSARNVCTTYMKRTQTV
ncbi:uncharacterized protein LOC124906620 isoform X2 [Homo sapiens]|uniref:uncharacterized protein LOC124906620 isoform X2 n=1 Tax=Homo sapiens TaxID=9606 RepID=UPI001FB1552A|nr:uncharacterized protein LOC124906620 isoform X2 [Homo sapiens]